MTMTTLPQLNSTDPEWPGRSQHRRCRCLDYCLVISLVVLTLGVGLLCALYFVLEKPQVAHRMQELTDHQSTSAHLVTSDVQLENTHLSWLTKGVGSMFLGSDFKLVDKELQVTRTGLYYVYSQMVLKCVDKDGCKEDGSATITVLKNGDKESPLLRLAVQISESTNDVSPSSFSGSLKHLIRGDRLSSYLWTDQKRNDWQLDEKDNNFFGLFWVSDVNTLRLHQ
ncbi:tumor necrosis factor ligand superfamily member 9 [Pelodytes ibericus]